MSTSKPDPKPLFVFLQRPDSGNWVPVGKYTPRQDGTGAFVYAPSYLESDLKLSIDPVNLPLVEGREFVARRYRGLNDILRDACPDAWGQALIRKETGLPDDAPPYRYLVHTGNGDRWGALAVGDKPKPNVAQLVTPRIESLGDLVEELLALANNQPPIRPRIRKRLFATASLGGVRPKLTVQDGQDYWLVKPTIHTDVTDIAKLECATQKWGAAAGLDFAPSEYREMLDGRGVVLVKRFDRFGANRVMTASAATLLQVQYPPVAAEDSTGASYPRLAEELRRIGAPVEDRVELFGRMVFNAMVGNDDDHCRNHAVLFSHKEGRWRLTPAFDVVPDTGDNPRSLAMQLSKGSRNITRESILGDFKRFGFDTVDAAADHLDRLIDRIVGAFEEIRTQLPEMMVEVLADRVQENRRILRALPEG